MFSLWIGIPLIVFGLLSIYLAIIIRIVRPPYKMIVEINGGSNKKINLFGKKILIKGIRVWDAGIHFLWIPIPMFMKIKGSIFCADETIVLQIGKEDGEGGSGKVEFKDDSAAVKAQLILRVVNPTKATYAIDDYREAAINRTESALRSYLGNKTLDEAMQEDIKTEISSKTFKDVNIALKQWGVKLNNPEQEVAIMDFDLTEETKKLRREILKAGKEKEAAIKKAEGEKESSILIAEGEKQSAILEAEGEAEGVKRIADKLNIESADAMGYIRSGQLYEAMASDGSTIISTSEGGTLNAPVNIAATMSAVGLGMQKKKGADNE